MMVTLINALLKVTRGSATVTTGI